MEVPFGPMSVWDILDRSVRLYRRHLWAIFSTTAFVALCLYVVNRLCVYVLEHYMHELSARPTRGLVLAALVLTLLVSTVAVTLSFVQTGVVAVAASDAYLGRRPSLSEALKRVPLRRLLNASVLAAFLINVGFMLLLVPGIVLMINLALVPIVVALEGRSPGASLKRSWNLVRARMGGGFWNSNVTRLVIIWSFLLILILLGYTIWAAIYGYLPDAWKTTETLKFPPLGTVQVPGLRLVPKVALNLVLVLIESFLQPFAFCALVLLYYDIRVAKEGLDIEQSLDKLQWRKG